MFFIPHYSLSFLLLFFVIVVPLCIWIFCWFAIWYATKLLCTLCFSLETFKHIHNLNQISQNFWNWIVYIVPALDGFTLYSSLKSFISNSYFVDACAIFDIWYSKSNYQQIHYENRPFFCKLIKKYSNIDNIKKIFKIQIFRQI